MPADYQPKFKAKGIYQVSPDTLTKPKTRNLKPKKPGALKNRSAKISSR